MTLRRIQRLGAGRLGETYLARWLPDDRLVAVKELTGVVPRDDSEFPRHIEALSRLDHPSLNNFLYYEADGSVCRVVQDFFDATDLQSYLRRPPSRQEVKALRQRDDNTDADDSNPANGDDTPDAADEHDETTAETPDDAPTPDDEPTDHSADHTTSSTDTTAPSETPPHTPGDEPDTSPDTDHDNGNAATSATTTVPSERPTTGPLQAVELETDNFEEQLPDEVDPRAQLDLLLYRLEQLLPQILAGLDYLHRFGHVHGDLSTTNILVNNEGQCRLVDYGLVTQLRPLGGDADSFDPRNAPADIPSDRPLQPSDDVYALGCLLFELITGLHPNQLRDASSLSDDQLPDGASDELDPSACDPEDLSLLQPRCPAEWVDLILRMLADDPDDRPGLDRIQEVVERTEARSVDVPPSLVPEQQSFFGRPELLDELTDRAADCADNDHLGLTLLSGEAGAGKSALAARTIHWAAEHGWLYLRGSCYPRESLILQGWDQIAARLANICHRLGPELRERIAPHRRRASRIFPVLRTTDESPPTCGRRTSVDALRQLLRILAAQRPILIVIDDLTWASWDTTALLGDMIVDPTEFPCFIVGTWRPDADTPKTQRLRDMLTTAPIDVGWLRMREFNPQEARDYVASVTDHMPDDHRQLIVDHGLRNPLLLQELVFQYHLERKSDDARAPDSQLADILQTNDPPAESDSQDSSAAPHDHHPPQNSYAVTATLPPGERPGHRSDNQVARHLRQLLDRRLDSLNRRQQFLVEILSVAALPLPEGLLSIVLEEEFHDEQSAEQSVRSILEELRNLRLVRRVDIHPWGDAFTLFHNIARTLVYRDLRDQRYTHLCSRVAEGLRQFWPQAKELRFEYLLRADRTDESVDLAVRSARDATDRFAFNRAAKLWRWIAQHGLDNAQASGLHPERELAVCEHGAGRHREAAELFRDIADTLPDSLEQLRIRYREFRARLEAGDRHHAIRALNDGLQHFGEHYDRVNLISRLSELKNRFLAASSRWSDRLESTDTDDLPTSTRLRGQLYFDAVRFDDILDTTRGDRFQAKLSAMAESTGHARLLGFDRILLAAESHRHGQLRRPERASERYDNADDLFSRADYPMGEAFSRLGRARLARRCGNFSQAASLLDDVRDCYDRQHDDAELMELDTRVERALLQRDAGDLDDALAAATRIRHLFRFSQLAQFRTHALMIPIFLARGRIQRAHDLLERCESFLDGQPRCWYTVWLARHFSRVHIARGQPEVAFVKLDVLREELESSGLASYAPVQRTLDLSIAQALLARAPFTPRLGEPDASRVQHQLKKIIRRLTDDLSHLTPPTQSEIHRLAARWRLARNRPQRALEAAESALSVLRHYPSPLARGRALEARARVLLSRGDEDAARTTFEAVHSVYDLLDLQFPLVLEGWPVPSELSRLRPDPAA